jgi:hypothetical protein
MLVIHPSSKLLTEVVKPAPHGSLMPIWKHPWHHAVTDQSGVIQIATKAGELPDRTTPSKCDSFNLYLENGVLIYGGKEILPRQKEPWSFEFHPLGLLIGFNDRICLLRLIA